jgi:DNA-binding transcriptional regulator YhcF (GntR family)
MRLWLSKNSDVPVREQLVSQIIIGVVSDDLKPGQRLPSTRELARRFGIHPNTVSAAYRHLARRGWVEFRKGSGVYVRAQVPDATPSLAPELELDGLISSLLHIARGRGFSLGEIQRRVKHWLESAPPDHFLVIEPDIELRRILMAEITEATGFRVAGASVEECGSALLAGAATVALYNQAEHVRAALPSDSNCLLLHTRSVVDSLNGAEKPPPETLVVIVSRWREFLRWAHTILIAAGLNPAAMSLRDAREPDWHKGLRASTFVITDALTASQLPKGCRPRIYRVIADASIAELRSYVELFLNT